MTARGPAARLLAAVTGLALVGGTAGCGLLGGDSAQRLTASFDRTVGLYEKSDVRILGVRVGQVTKIVPEGDTVRVEMEYDPKYKVPADAKAVVIAPSVVSDRYVQLTPVYTGGPVMADGVVLANESTAVPVELDEIFSSVDKIDLALGPDGANKDGALSDLLDVGAKNLDGNGKVLGSTLHDFSTAVQTLSDQRGDLFGTITNLQDFTTTLARNDGVVRRFNADLADVAEQLEGEKEDLAQAIKSLSVALSEVAGFVRDNKDDLTKNVSDLASITGVLVKQKKALAEFLDNSPAALGNLQLAYNPESGTLDTRANNTGALLPFTVCALAVNPPVVGDLAPALVKDRLMDLCERALTGLTSGQLEDLLDSDQLPEELTGLVDSVLDGLPDGGGTGGGTGGDTGGGLGLPLLTTSAESDMTLTGYLGDR